MFDTSLPWQRQIINSSVTATICLCISTCGYLHTDLRTNRGFGRCSCYSGSSIYSESLVSVWWCRWPISGWRWLLTQWHSGVAAVVSTERAGTNTAHRLTNATRHWRGLCGLWWLVGWRVTGFEWFGATREINSKQSHKHAESRISTDNLLQDIWLRYSTALMARY